MESLKTSRRDRQCGFTQHHFLNKSGAGFTLVEIMVAIGLLVIILGLSLFLTMDFYRSYAFRYEQNLVVSILQKARSQAMANVDQTNHGVCMEQGGLNYIIFGGAPPSPCAGISKFPKAAAITVPPFSPIVFKQLDGACVTCATPLKITLTGQGKTADIIIYGNGRIDW